MIWRNASKDAVKIVLLCVVCYQVFAKNVVREAQYFELQNELVTHNYSPLTPIETWILRLKRNDTRSNLGLRKESERFIKNTRQIDFFDRTIVPPKLIREIKSLDDSDDYNDETTTASTVESKKKHPKEIINEKSVNHTRQGRLEEQPITISLKVLGIIILVTVFLTCCCTLFIRNRLMRIVHKITGKNKKSKQVDAEKGKNDFRRRLSLRKTERRQNREPSYDMVHTATQNSLIAVPERQLKEPDEPPTGCYKCYKKKRKKARRSRRY